MGFSRLEFSEKATLLGYPFLRIAERFFFSGNREYVTLSNWMKERVGLYFPRLNRARVRVIYNSVDTNVFTPGGREIAESILFTGRFIAAKGLTYLAGAIPMVLRRHPNATFTFIGPGNFQPYMNLLLKFNVPSRNVKFVGYVKDREAILDYYRRCSIFVVPTLYENLPTRALEAMACSKPVVATDVNAIPELITSGLNGILVPPRSSEALAKEINGLLDSRFLRRLIGSNARDTVVSRFDWNLNARRMAKLYEEVAEAS